MLIKNYNHGFNKHFTNIMFGVFQIIVHPTTINCKTIQRWIVTGAV